jgi:XisH protein
VRVEEDDRSVGRTAIALFQHSDRLGRGKPSIAWVETTAIMYSRILQKLEPDRQLYLAVNRSISEGLFNEEVGKLLLDEPGFRMIVFDPSVEEIIQWIP